MKNIFLAVLLVSASLASFAQDDEEKGGFKKEKLFTGGSLTLQFGNQFTALGISPYFGYSLNKYIDVAASLNFNYTSQRDYYIIDDKVRQTVYGPGAFVRIYPVKFLFAQAQYEFNMIKQKYIPGSGYPNEKATFDAHSFLIGGGYAGGRENGSNSFYYFSVLWDIGKNDYSPYKDNQLRAVPIFRAGYNIGLFQGRRR
ncbi:MAG: hypothetical protein QM687_16140 [Ferruginibacter sp.]